jgi:hypothetical protein
MAAVVDIKAMATTAIDNHSIYKRRVPDNFGHSFFIPFN